MVSQRDILAIFDVGEVLTAHQIRDRLPGNPHISGIVHDINRLRRWGHFKNAVVSKSPRGAKIWGYRRLW